MANPELQEWEFIKLAKVAAVLAGALRERGVREPGATLAAEAGVAIFRVTFDRWIGGADRRSLAATITDSARHLRALTSVHWPLVAAPTHPAGHLLRGAIHAAANGG